MRASVCPVSNLSAQLPWPRGGGFLAAAALSRQGRCTAAACGIGLAETICNGLPNHLIGRRQPTSINLAARCGARTLGRPREGTDVLSGDARPS